MKWAVSQIKKQAFNEPFKFDEMVDVSELATLNNDLIRIDPVHVKGQCDFRHGQYIFDLVIEGEMILPCARTLVEVPYPFSISTREIFASSDMGSEHDEIHPIDGEVLDLMPIIKENILLEIPFRVFSEDAEAEAAAPKSGNGWELVTEGNTEPKIDPRLQKLQSLLKDRKNEE
ncbi:YceD family protein [Aciduricibacillus chroicocephali]|uniref:YceD family protein n=1 Tax=Aciduricibacillus chroicocephali TaxID=3054939 RepID=A0ABY9KYF2_9BACI|nr:YceD family protein [Bacillaceae bacterium 44XB]